MKIVIKQGRDGRYRFGLKADAAPHFEFWSTWAPGYETPGEAAQAVNSFLEDWQNEGFQGIFLESGERWYV